MTVPAAANPVVFLATPHSGSGISDVATTLCKIVRHNQPFLGPLMRPTPALADLTKDNPLLLYLGDWYDQHAHANEIETIAFAEGRKVAGVTMVVSQSSANPHAGSVTIRLPREDHISIAKPGNRKAAVFESLDNCLNKVKQRTSRLGMYRISSRTALAPETTRLLAEKRRLITRISGAWWEFMNREDPKSISFIRIVPDLLSNSVSLIGTSYNAKGKKSASWNSVVAKIETETDKIVVHYYWKGEHLDTERSADPFHGSGELRFDDAEGPETVTTWGDGRYWDINDNKPTNINLKGLELRRVTKADDIQTMSGPPSSRAETLVNETMEGWDVG